MTNSEGFHVRPAAVAGYGLLVAEVREQLDKVRDYISDHGGAKSGYDGLIMSALRGPVDAYTSAASARLTVPHSWHLGNTAAELQRTAWVYTHADELDYTEYDPLAVDNGKIVGRVVVGYKDFPDPDPFPVSIDPTGELTPPVIAEIDLRAKVDEVGGSLKVIDSAVRLVTGWSPVEAIIEPISGNWNALTASGDTLIKAGDALEESLSNLTKALPQLDASWDGGAAQSFTTYLNGLVTGAGQEGPLNRLVGTAYQRLAEEIEKVAGLVVTKLKSIVDQLGERMVPLIGWVRMLGFIRECVHIFQEVKAAIDKLIAVKEQVIQLIEIAKDPVGALRDKVDEKLSPIVENAEVARDLIEVAKVNEWTATPTGYYTSGDNPRRPGA